jgi:hypothetical protein
MIPLGTNRKLHITALLILRIHLQKKVTKKTPEEKEQRIHFLVQLKIDSLNRGIGYPCKQQATRVYKSTTKTQKNGKPLQSNLKRLPLYPKRK